jgi:hypothetical protein
LRRSCPHLALILLFASGQAAVSAEPPSSGKFISADRSFELIVPPGYVVLTSKDKAGGYTPICHDDSLVCITYPPGRYNGTTFQGASLEVTLLPAKTEKTCINPGKYEVSTLPEAEFRIDANSPKRVIDGVRFLHARTGGAALSHDIVSDLYRGFTHGKCYQLSVRVTFAVFAVYDAGTIKEFTKADQKRVTAELTRILDSFRALP